SGSLSIAMICGASPSRTSPLTQDATISGVLWTLVLVGSATGPLSLHVPTSLAGRQPPLPSGKEQVFGSSFFATHPSVGTARRISAPAASLVCSWLRAASPDTS